MRRQSARLERQREVSHNTHNDIEEVSHHIDSVAPTDEAVSHMDEVAHNLGDDSDSDYDELPSFNYVPKYVDMDMLDLDALTDDISVLDEQAEETDVTDLSDEDVKEITHVSEPLEVAEVAEEAPVTDFMELFTNTEEALPELSERWPMVDKNEHLSSFSSLNAFIPVPVESVPVSPVQQVAQMQMHMPPMPQMPVFNPTLDINDIVDSSACSDSDSVSASDSALWTERYNSIPICGFRNSLQRDDSYQSFVKSSMTKSKKRAAHFVVPGINKRSFLSGRAQAMLL